MNVDSCLCLTSWTNKAVNDIFVSFQLLFPAPLLRFFMSKAVLCKTKMSILFLIRTIIMIIIIITFAKERKLTTWTKRPKCPTSLSHRTHKDPTNLSGRGSGRRLPGRSFQAAGLLPTIELPQVSRHWQAHSGPGVQLLLLHTVQQIKNEHKRPKYSIMMTLQTKDTLCLTCVRC